VISGLTATTAPVPAAGFTEAMGALAGGVALVTCWSDRRPWGMTVTAFASVSADPPTVLVSLATATVSASAIAATRRFGLSVLAADQGDVARYGSAPGGTKFLEPFVAAENADSATPVVAGAIAHIDCDVTEVVAAADHTVFLGRVRAVRSSPDGLPLLYHRRSYRTLADLDQVRR
jgi:3-hydroxy-9,10-secoandrosta-1,3,5(10)-triene-9,17-dione monooxygenase reductase component